MGGEEQAQLQGAIDPDSIPLWRLAVPVPYVVPERAPVKHFYSLFAKAGAAVVCTLSRKGTFKGIITRDTIIRESRKAEEDEDDEASDQEHFLDFILCKQAQMDDDIDYAKGE